MCGNLIIKGSQRLYFKNIVRNVMGERKSKTDFGGYEILKMTKNHLKFLIVWIYIKFVMYEMLNKKYMNVVHLLNRVL